MIVILANRWDTSAYDLATRWQVHNARVLTARDLSRSGWQQRPSQPDRASVVIDGETFPQREIRGVLTRLPCIYAQELGYVVPADRTYIAEEMNAFLHFWLAGLPCPVVNRPTPGSFNGPSWRSEQWVPAAAAAGFEVAPLWPPPADEPPAVETLTVAGGRCFGARDAALCDSALRLATLAGTSLLGVRAHAGRFYGVNLLPDLSNDEIAGAVLGAFVHPAGEGA